MLYVACVCSLHWYQIAGLEDLLNTSNVGSVCEQGSLSNVLPNLSQQTATVACAFPGSSPQCAWSIGHQATVQCSGQSSNGQCELMSLSSLAEGGRRISDGLPTSTSSHASFVTTHQQSMMQGNCHSESGINPTVSRCSSGLSTSAGLHAVGRRSSQTCHVELKPAETSAVESSVAAERGRRRLSTLELGNMHLRDLLSRDDDDNNDVDSSVTCHSSNDSPQEPQSTFCDDPPDSSTGNVRSSSGASASILKQLLSDSDSEEQNEVHSCEPESTDVDNNESHVLLKVCWMVFFIIYLDISSQLGSGGTGVES